jgi:enamine deaminase RidA (YjgF/YER057c/UK114 family)
MLGITLFAFSTLGFLTRRSVNVVTKRSLHVENKIVELGYKMPAGPPLPKGNYMTYVQSGPYLYLAGHLPLPVDGDLMTGRLGENVDIESGQKAAHLCGMQMLASIKEALGDLDRVKRVVKIVGFVNSSNDFTDQAKVLNGCSDLMGEVFGTDVGRHARSAIGTSVLPLGVPVEIEAIIEIKDP